ncbi:MAG: ATP-dependent helicase HrpB, partial [Kiritimatiellae bacterium]|nr:ATP-dependent helicase HrpB [Kiritimatiellia bacterium]
MSPVPARLPDLPVRAVLPEVARALDANRPVVLQAPPGSGKTMLVAPSLLRADWLRGRRIVLLEPRRLAARAAARYMARLLGEEVGQTVGYQVRLERRTSSATRIEILTEGLLTQRLLGDPELTGVGLVIFDEFHERNLAADFSLALTLDMHRALRPDLRLLAMSATLDAEPVAQHLGDAAIVTATSRVWPVETRYLPRPVAAPLPRQVADAVIRALADAPGGILVFLPGEGEIRRTETLLRDMRLSPEVTLHPLYGALPRHQQDAAVEPSPPGRRKVVLATSIAESSLTIQDIRIVIDGGWMRVPRFSPHNGMSRLETLRVTRDRAEQRQGRAGRLGPGICYRLWDEATDRSLAPRALPEILDADLAPICLHSADWGATGRESLPWLTPPPDAAWRQATALLRELEALDDRDRITTRGRRLARLPVHPRLAHMIALSEAAGCPRRACLLAAAIEEAAGESSLRHETDARRLLDRLDGELSQPTERQAGDWAHRVRQLAHAWGHGYPARDTAPADAGRLLAWAYPDRVAQRREADGQFRMASGRGATLDTGDALARAPWLAVAELQDGGADARIRLAAPIDPADLAEDFAAQLTTTESVAWDRRAERVVAQRRQRLGALVLGEAPLREPAGEAVLGALLEGVRLKGVANLGWSDAARNLQARIAFLRRVCPEADWPDVSDAAMQARLEEWLGPWLKDMTRWEQARRVDLAPALLSLIGGRQRQLETLAPTHWRLPGGGRA